MYCIYAIRNISNIKPYYLACLTLTSVQYAKFGMYSWKHTLHKGHVTIIEYAIVRNAAVTLQTVHALSIYITWYVHFRKCIVCFLHKIIKQLSILQFEMLNDACCLKIFLYSTLICHYTYILNTTFTNCILYLGRASNNSTLHYYQNTSKH